MCSLRFTRRLVPMLVLALLVLGCGKEINLTGSVTVDGQPLDKGQLTLWPVADKSKPVGAEISSGKFLLKGLTPGKYRAEVTATPVQSGPMPANMDEAAKMKPPPDPLPPGTKGNNETIEITGKDQAPIEIKLTKPK